MTNDACLNAVIEKDDPTDVFRLEEEIGNGGFGIVYKVFIFILPFKKRSLANSHFEIILQREFTLKKINKLQLKKCQCLKIILIVMIPYSTRSKY